jgi:hypothetical protein
MPLYILPCTNDSCKLTLYKSNYLHPENGFLKPPEVFAFLLMFIKLPTLISMEKYSCIRQPQCLLCTVATKCLHFLWR